MTSKRSGNFFFPSFLVYFYDYYYTFTVFEWVNRYIRRGLFIYTKIVKFWLKELRIEVLYNSNQAIIKITKENGVVVILYRIRKVSSLIYHRLIKNKVHFVQRKRKSIYYLPKTSAATFYNFSTWFSFYKKT